MTAYGSVSSVICPECGRNVLVRPTGRLFSHRREIKRVSPYCPNSGMEVTSVWEQILGKGKGQLV